MGSLESGSSAVSNLLTTFLLKLERTSPIRILTPQVNNFLFLL